MRDRGSQGSQSCELFGLQETLARCGEFPHLREDEIRGSPRAPAVIESFTEHEPQRNKPYSKPHDHGPHYVMAMGSQVYAEPPQDERIGQRDAGAKRAAPPFQMRLKVDAGVRGVGRIPC